MGKFYITIFNYPRGEYYFYIYYFYFVVEKNDYKYTHLYPRPLVSNPAIGMASTELNAVFIKGMTDYQMFHK